MHQAVEFGNRMITFSVVLTAAAGRAGGHPRPPPPRGAGLRLADAGVTVLQAVIGGITVLTGLLWWTVAIHLLASMTMVWLAVLLYVKIGEPDDGSAACDTSGAESAAPADRAERVALAAVLVAGTLVTGAGPHAGDKSLDRPVPRLEVEIITLVHLHSSLLVAYLALLVGLGFALLAVRAPRPVLLRLGVLLVLVCAQGLVGTVQFFTGVPAALVAVHVAGAAGVHRGHRRAMGVDARADQAPAAPGRPRQRRRMALRGRPRGGG